MQLIGGGHVTVKGNNRHVPSLLLSTQGRAPFASEHSFVPAGAGSSGGAVAEGGADAICGGLDDTAVTVAVALAGAATLTVGGGCGGGFM